MKSIFIGMPNMGEVRVELIPLLASWLCNPSLKTEIFAPSYKSPITFAHNLIVEEFLKGSCEWLFLLNADVVPPQNAVQCVETEFDVVGLPAPIYRDGVVTWTAFRRSGDAWRPVVQSEIEGKKWVEVDAIGGGCLIVRRKVFEKLDKPFFRFVYDEKGFVEVGEDFDFCRRVKEAGFRLGVYVGDVCSHWHKVDLNRCPTFLDRLRAKGISPLTVRLQ